MRSLVVLLWACAATDPDPPTPGNVLVILLDDVGRDKIDVYADHPFPAPTPRIDALAAEGVLFRNAYALPMCSPTRAALLTGRYPSRNGVGHLIEADDQTDYLADEDTLPEMLRRSAVPYATALTGKWHLGTVVPPHLGHPGEVGFDTWAGSLENLRVASEGDGATRGYFHWEKNTDGSLGYNDTYAVTDTTDDAIDRVHRMPEPWFLYVAYNGAHEPFHVPPAALHPSTPVTAASPVVDLMDAMVESVDTELGRLLDTIDPAVRARTTILVMGDNGTTGQVVRPPWPHDREKGSVLEASVRVPFLVAGPLVSAPGSESEALVHVVDVFPTAAELAGVHLDDGVVRDGFSLVPLLADPSAPSRHRVLFSEKFRPNGAPTARSYTVRDHAYKLVGVTGLPDALYALGTDPWSEGADLVASGPLSVEAQSAFAHLRAEADDILADLGVEP